MENDTWDVTRSLEDVASKVESLGPPQAEFSVSAASFTRQVLGAVLLAGLGMAMIVMPLSIIWFRAVAETFILFKLVILGLIFLSGAVFLVQRAYRNRGLRVLVYPEGLVRLHRGEAQALFWDEVDLVSHKRPTGHWARFAQGKLVLTLKRSNGTELSFDDSLPDLQRLGTIVHRETLEHLLPRTLGAIDNGSGVTFGKVHLSRKGIHNSIETVAWTKLKPLRVENDRFYIEKQGNWLPWHNGSISETPNFHVLQAVVKERAIPSDA
jgi:hypothetical protein